MDKSSLELVGSCGLILFSVPISKAQYKGEVEAMKKATEAKENRDENIENRTKEIKKRIEEKKKQDLEDLKRDINADQVFKDLGIDKKG
jgi:hypothetical protein